MAMNWSFFKPEFSCKPEEDPEAHILRETDLTDTHNFAMGKRVQIFPLALASKARLQYQSIHPFQGNLEELQERFRIHFSKIGNTKCYVR